ncbi:hypothetical protein ACJX0J_024514 [Zea mays]
MSKENKATSHTPLIDHHYKTYHHRQTGRKFQIHITHRASHHLAFCCPIGRMIVNTWVPLQSRNSTENITIVRLITKNITADLRKRVMEYKKKIATEGEKKGGTKGKIVMKTDYASCIIH